MAKFVTRIELMDADKNDYQHLQEEMKKELFSLVKTIPSNLQNKSMSPVEYALEGNISLSDVTDATWRAARRTGKKYSFTIIRQKMGYEYDRSAK